MNRILALDFGRARIGVAVRRGVAVGAGVAATATAAAAIGAGAVGATAGAAFGFVARRAVVAGVAVTSVPPRMRPVALGAVALTVIFGFLHPIPGNRNYDMFQMVAGDVGPRLESRPLVTAAPATSRPATS